MFPRQLEANGRQWSHPGEDSRTRWLTNTGSQRNSTHVQSILLQHLLCQYDLQRYSVYNITMISIFQHLSRHSDPSLQHLVRHCDLHGYNIYHVTMIPIITTPITSLWSLLPQHLPWHYDLYLLQPTQRHYYLYCYSTYYVNSISRYSIYYVTMISIVPATITTLWFPLLQHPSRHYDSIDIASTTSLCSPL